MESGRTGCAGYFLIACIDQADGGNWGEDPKIGGREEGWAGVGKNIFYFSVRGRPPHLWGAIKKRLNRVLRRLAQKCECKKGEKEELMGGGLWNGVAIILEDVVDGPPS